jgi:hypothetical protein
MNGLRVTMTPFGFWAWVDFYSWAVRWHKIGSNAAVESPTVLLLTSGAKRLFGSQRTENPEP